MNLFCAKFGCGRNILRLSKFYSRLCSHRISFAVVPPWLLREVAKTRAGEANGMRFSFEQNKRRSNRRFVASLCNFLFQKEKVLAISKKSVPHFSENCYTFFIFFREKQRNLMKSVENLGRACGKLLILKGIYDIIIYKYYYR